MTDNTVQGLVCERVAPLAGAADEVAVTVAEIVREQRAGAGASSVPVP